MSLTKFNFEDEDEFKMDESSLHLPKIADACQTRTGNKDQIWSISYDGFLFQIELPS